MENKSISTKSCKPDGCKKACAIMALAKTGKIDAAYTHLDAVYREYTRLRIAVPDDYVMAHLAILSAEVAMERRMAS